MDKELSITTDIEELRGNEEVRKKYLMV